MTSQFFSRPHVQTVEKSLYTLEDNRPLQWNAFRQCQLTAAALSLALALLLHRVTQVLHKEPPAIEFSSVLNLDDEKDAIRVPAKCAQAELRLDDHRPLVSKN